VATRLLSSDKTLVATRLLSSDKTLMPLSDSSRAALALRESAPKNNRVRGGDHMAVDFARTDPYSQSEGRVAKAIEDQTSKLPSDTFLWMAVGAMAASATLQMIGNRHVSLFVGQWAPTFLIFGLYNKLVKQLGSDRTQNAV
jgi:hypothetical protein